MPGYAQMYFAQKEEDIPISKVIMKLPSRFRNRIIQWKLPIKKEQMTLWGVKGQSVQMPFTYTMYLKMCSSRREAIFQKIEKMLHKESITHILLPKILKTSPFSDIQVCRGDNIKSFFIMDVIQLISRGRLANKKLKDIEVVILDGHEKKVDMMIDFIYPHINYLTIITKAPERFEEKVEDIFEDVGLNIQVSSYNNVATSQGDIVIDPHYDDPGFIHKCKKGAVYIDMGNNSQKTAILTDRQNTVRIIHDFLLTYKGEALDTDKAELVLAFKNMFKRNYKETKATLENERIKVTTCKLTSDS